MSRRRRIPALREVAASLFEARQPPLRERFPEPDSTTGLYCIEAVGK
jgi:hypothetical protein